AQSASYTHHCRGRGNFILETRVARGERTVKVSITPGFVARVPLSGVTLTQNFMGVSNAIVTRF
ncbi:MAG: hypothetical protein WCQ60_02710, partial [bacterium]